MGRGKDDNVEEYDFEQSRKDDNNLSKAGHGWDEDSGDPAIELLKEIREDTDGS